MLAAAILSTALLAPQGRVLDYPQDVVAAQFAPFVDAQGQPVRTEIVAAGAGELDAHDNDGDGIVEGDGNPEVWLLAADGAISVQMPETADLGRFRPYAVVPAPGPWVAGATYRSTTRQFDRVLLADPDAPILFELLYVPSNAEGPRHGMFVVQQTAWSAGRDVRELQTADHDHDGHDDIMALLRTAAGDTTVVKLRMGTSRGQLDHESTVSVAIPAPSEKLRMLDLDADGRSDFVVHVPGLGVLSFVDDGTATFRLRDWVPVPLGTLRDLVAGDADGDGRDDFALVADFGVFVLLSRPAGGLSPVALAVPAGVGTLASAKILDAAGDPARDVVAIPRDGRNFVVHPFDAASGRHLEPFVQKSPITTDPLGPNNPGILGEAARALDLDNDGDDELLLQQPTGETWVTLFGPTEELRPIDVKIESQGPIGTMGFVVENFRVTLPATFFARGVPELELGVFLIDPYTNEQVYWHRMLLQPDPVSRSVSFLVNVMIDQRNLGFLFGPPRYTVHTNGGITAGGPTVLTIHGKHGTRRFGAVKIEWDGRPDGSGSAVGVRWRVVAAPTLPLDDDELLPWN